MGNFRVVTLFFNLGRVSGIGGGGNIASSCLVVGGIIPLLYAYIVCIFDHSNHPESPSVHSGSHSIVDSCTPFGLTFRRTILGASTR